MTNNPEATSDTQAIRDDLAFLRGLVRGGDEFLKWFGGAYFAGGACYLAQTLLGVAQTQGWIDPRNAPLNLAIAFGPTAIFVVVFSYILRKDPSRSVMPGQGSRAIGAVFGAAGLANLVLVAVIGSIAAREKSFTVWLIYPCTVFVLQGAAWLTMFSVRRRAWTALVAVLWFGCALGMAFEVGDMLVYLLIASLGLGAGMAAPGAWLMTRRSV
jgi:hypothetical protein